MHDRSVMPEPAIAPGTANVDALVLDAFRHALARDGIGPDGLGPDLIGPGRIGPDDNFFTCGGDSVRALRLVETLGAGVGVTVPIAILFRHPTPRQMASFLRPAASGAARENGGSTSPSVVALNAPHAGRPVFLVPALYPSPWMFLPLVESLKLTRPIYGLRAPELDWPADVLSLRELVVHYAAEIRRVQPHGPYSLIGYSFGGTLAFEIACRLSRDDEVRDLVLLDSRGPLYPWQRLLQQLEPQELYRTIVTLLVRRGIVGPRTLKRLGLKSPVLRLMLPFGRGPLTRRELQLALRILDAGDAGDAGSRNSMTHDQMCAALIARCKAGASAKEWERISRMLPLNKKEPVQAIKACKVFVKNKAISKAHRFRHRFDGTIVIVAHAANTGVRRWARFSSRPLNIVWVEARKYQHANPHLAFLEPGNVALYSGALRARLTESESAAAPLPAATVPALF